MAVGPVVDDAIGMMASSTMALIDPNKAMLKVASSFSPAGTPSPDYRALMDSAAEFALTSRA
jgi:hypothetical protein